MKTKNDYLTEARKDNPKPLFFDANGIKIELSDDEYETAIHAWADMRLIQIAEEEKQVAKEAAKKALIEKLGLTADEISALFG
jgi:hypothetical protein